MLLVFSVAVPKRSIFEVGWHKAWQESFRVYNKGMRKYHLWLIEIIVWALIIVAISIPFYNNISHKKELNATGHAFFEDTDGLIVGSPVRFMGTQVGYLSNVEIIGSEAYVSFVITEKNLKIPHGTIATVEFTGIAGSKSLELYPPTKESLARGHAISVVDPIRLSTFVSNQQSIATNLINMTNQINMLVTKNNISQIRNWMNTAELFSKSNEMLDNFNDFEDNAINKLKVRQENRKKNEK